VEVIFIAKNAFFFITICLFYFIIESWFACAQPNGAYGYATKRYAPDGHAANGNATDGHATENATTTSAIIA
jgi:hypothetical protein